MSGITLYGPAEAPFTVKVERALQLKGVEYLLVSPESQADYRRWNPETGLLPVLDCWSRASVSKASSRKVEM